MRLHRPSNNHILTWWVVVICFLTGNYATSQTTDWRERFEQELLDLQLGNLETRLDFEHDVDIRAFYKQHAEFIQAFAVQNVTSYDAYLQTSTWAESFLAQRNVSNISHTLMAEIALERSLVQGLQSNYFAAAQELRKCLKHIRNAERQSPNSGLLLRVKGLVQIGLASVPRQYQWVTASLGLVGDMDLGLRLLQASAAKPDILQLETHLMLFYIEKNLMVDHFLANRHIDSLYQANPGLVVITYSYASEKIENKENGKAITAFRQYLAQSGNISRLPHLHYSYGRALLFSGEYGSATAQLRLFTSQFQGKLLRQDAIFKIGLALLLSGNRQGFIDEMRRTVATPPSGFDEDDYASRQAAHYITNFPNDNDLKLLRARLRFDGGYIGQCEAELQAAAANLTLLSPDQRAELYYRQGRLWHYRGDPVKAKAYYNLCVKQHAARNVWMQAFAHFYMGKIFEENADWHEARLHFREALNYTGYPYQNGLEQRCRSGLSRLRTRTFEVPGDGN